MTMQKGEFRRQMKHNPQIFGGVVITSNSGSRSVTIMPDSHESSGDSDLGAMMQGIPVSATMSSLFGFKLVDLPQPGARVLCVENNGTSCYIIGMLPAEVTEASIPKFPSRAMLGAKDALADSANRIGHAEYLTTLLDNHSPTDVVDGEHVIANEFGVLLGLFQQLAMLKASELAQVQCHLLDDLVRIISHNFQHYTALGEYNIYHDGQRLMAEFGATHKTSEMYGVPAVDSEVGEPMFEKTGKHSVDDSKDFFDISEDERIKAIERFKIFLGSVGDFFHLFLVRPDTDEKRFLDPAWNPQHPDTGLCDVHIGTDGGLHLRSVKEVFIEKTNWIRIPVRKAAPDDPKGDDAETLEYTEKKEFKFDNTNKYKKNPYAYALQIRDYVAYVNETLNYQNFKKHEKDFYVNSDKKKEKPLKEIKKIDKETSLYLRDYELRTAGIYLMPNGGITIRDAWNSAIVMEGGDIYLQPAKDLVAQPLRDHVVRAGNNFNVNCRGQIDLVSRDEGVRIKSAKTQHFYSSIGGVILESDCELNVPRLPELDPDANKDTEDQGAIDHVGGIVLKSKLSIYNYAKKDVVSYAENDLLFESVKKASVVAEQGLTLYGKAQLTTLSDGYVLNYSQGDIHTFSDSGVILAGNNYTTFGQKDQQLGVASAFPVEGVVDVPKVTAEFDKLIEFNQTILPRTPFYLKPDKNKPTQPKHKFDDLAFKFPSSKQYQLNELDIQPSTLAQQDDLLTDSYNLEVWKEDEINRSLPYPGRKLFSKFYLKAQMTKNLHQEQSAGSKDTYSGADAAEIPAKITRDTLDKYKVLPRVVSKIINNQ